MMQVILKKQVAEKLPREVLANVGVDGVDGQWFFSATVDLDRFQVEALEALRDALYALNGQGVRNSQKLANDINAYLGAVAVANEAPMESVKVAEPVLKQLLAVAPGHRVYGASKYTDEVVVPFYVNSIKYVPTARYTPEHIEMELLWTEFGELKERKVQFYAAHLVGRRPSQALAQRGYVTETHELREAYRFQYERYAMYAHQVGLKMLGRGVARTQPERRKHDWPFEPDGKLVILDRNAPAQVVVDYLTEDGLKEEQRFGIRTEKTAKLNVVFWSGKKRVVGKPKPQDLSDEEDDGGEREYVVEPVDPELERESGLIEVPSHLFVPCFDLLTHNRVRVHVAQLEPYVYDNNLRHKLVLPDDVKQFVEMLLDHKSAGFEDIVSGKSGGVVVMLTGPPGTGKTLTGEVYAETMGRPLYRVHAAQLGTNEEELEKNLLIVLARAERWNAILLIDEADVYIRKRGEDIQQNAIVGVFLRVLEYFRGVMFLTTNIPEEVDDAVISRCLARIDYSIPSQDDQARIWRVLADQAGVRMSDESIAQVVEANPVLSGRDVKNLLKLAKLVSEAQRTDVALKTVEYVQRFKPTTATAKKRCSNCQLGAHNQCVGSDSCGCQHVGV